MISTKRKIFLLIVLLALLTQSRVGAEPFTIREFKTERVQPQQGNPIVVPADGRFLRTINDSEAPGSGIVMRRKFGKDEYGLFSGLMKEGGYSRLKGFRIDSLDQGKLLKLKIYDSPARDWYLDLDEVYFEDQLVLVEGRSEIHYQSGGVWKKALALSQPPSRLNVSSSPPGALVWIDGNPAGKTPLTLRGIGQPLLRVQMRLPGFYMVDEPVQVKPGQEQSFFARLVVQADADTQSLGSFDSSTIAKFRLANAPGQSAYVERQAKLVRFRDSLQNEMQADLVRFDRGYPLMKGKDEFEKSGEFEKRKSEYESERIAQKRRFSMVRETQLEFISATVQAIDSLLRPYEERRVRVASACPVKLGLYDADSEVQSLNVECAEPGIRYSGACNLALAPESARRLRIFPDSLSLVFYGWNVLSAASDGQIANMNWDTLGFMVFNEPEKPGKCDQVPSQNVSEAFFMERAEVKGAFYRREAARRQAESIARKDSLAAVETRLAQDRERRLAEENEEKWRNAGAKRKRMLRSVRLGLGSVLATTAVVMGWNGYSHAQKAEVYSDRYQNSLSVQATKENKDGYYRHNRKSTFNYLTGSALFAVSLPLLAF